MAQDPIPKDLFDIIACPMCKSDIKYINSKKALQCTKCKAKFEIKDGIPLLLPKNS
tara:strand:- start:757 stop:924 length:168 start_codon:yes stop_codon:yes gene_type:complete